MRLGRESVMPKSCVFKFLTKSSMRHVVLLLMMTVLWTVQARAEENPQERDVLQGMLEHLDYSIRMMTFGVYQDPADTTQNPGNNFLRLPRYRTGLEIRPDIDLNTERLHLSAKPRFNLQRRQWEEGVWAGETQWNDDWFINEWLMRIRANDSLFLSYGRENLQWGPSYLLSPSNPFFRDNGRRNPKQEVPGMDFARAVWLPAPFWTMSLIANTDEGRQSFSPALFKKCYALKVDYTGQESYGSLILSYREGGRKRLGFFTGWTATDALLLYAEGTLSRGSDAYYPQADEGPFSASMQALYENDSSLQPTVLLGGSYTLEMGPTLTLEYVYNGPGYSDADAERFYRLRDCAAEGFLSSSPEKAPAADRLSIMADPGLRLLRRNYLMVQYNQNDIRGVLNLTLRWTQNLDDYSGQFISVLEYYIGDHLEVFSIGTVNAGGEDTEFGSILDLNWMVGLEYTF